MKKVLIVALVCINVALVALVLARELPRADAQTFRGASNYLLFAGHIEENYDAVYVVDLDKRKLAAWKFDQTTKKLIPYRGRDLAKDFRQAR